MNTKLTLTIEQIVMYLFYLQFRWDFPAVNCYRSNVARVVSKGRLASTEH